MAGNPIALLVPYIKKYGVQIYLILGPLLYLMNERKIQNTYATVYSENDFQRKYYLEKLAEVVNPQNNENHPKH